MLAVPPVPSLNENQSLTDKGCRRVRTLGRNCDLVGNADYKDLNQISRVMDKEENSPYDKDKQEKLRKFKRLEEYYYFTFRWFLFYIQSTFDPFSLYQEKFSAGSVSRNVEAPHYIRPKAKMAPASKTGRFRNFS